MERKNIENAKLEQMRHQMVLLKDKVASQELVNDRIMRKIMLDNVKKLNKNAIVIGLITIVAMVYVPWTLMRMKLPIAFLVATDVFMAIPFAYNIWSNWGIKAQNVMDGDLVDTCRRVARMRKMSQRWLFFGLPFLAVWIVWFGYELFMLSGSWGSSAIYMVVGGCLGGIAGALLGYSFYRKNQRQAAEVIEQINELLKE